MMDNTNVPLFNEVKDVLGLLLALASKTEVDFVSKIDRARSTEILKSVNELLLSMGRFAMLETPINAIDDDKTLYSVAGALYAYGFKFENLR